MNAELRQSSARRVRIASSAAVPWSPFDTPSLAFAGVLALAVWAFALGMYPFGDLTPAEWSALVDRRIAAGLDVRAALAVAVVEVVLVVLCGAAAAMGLVIAWALSRLDRLRAPFDAAAFCADERRRQVEAHAGATLGGELDRRRRKRVAMRSNSGAWVVPLDAVASWAGSGRGLAPDGEEHRASGAGALRRMTAASRRRRIMVYVLLFVGAFAWMSLLPGGVAVALAAGVVVSAWGLPTDVSTVGPSGLCYQPLIGRDVEFGWSDSVCVLHTLSPMVLGATWVRDDGAVRHCLMSADSAAYALDRVAEARGRRPLGG